MIAGGPPMIGFALLVALLASAIAAAVLACRRPRSQGFLDVLLYHFARWSLWLRYRIRIRGLRRVARQGRQGILFLPNHPALIEPIILTTILRPAFRPRPLADENQIDRFFIRRLAKRVGVLAIPDPAKVGAAGRGRIQAALREIAAALRRGENVLLYPSGRVYRSRFERVTGSAVEWVLRSAPEARVVLVRTRGLWGSSFSWASGREPNVAAALAGGIRSLLLSGVVFAPRREVTIELHEPADLPRGADRAVLNAYLEGFYNEDAPHSTYVPRTILEPGGARRMGEPAEEPAERDLSRVPPATRQIVAQYLQDLTGRGELHDDDRLARDLGLDSLAAADLVAWLEGEFGFPQASVESLRTVGDVLLAACGQTVAAAEVELKRVRRKWFSRERLGAPVALPEGQTINEVFLRQAARWPTRPIAADPIRGELSYRRLITAVYALKPVVQAVEGRRVGIMLPAGVAADILYLTALFAGKTPVVVNWTAGPRNARHALDLADCPRVLTAERLVRRLAQQGIDLTGLSDRFVYLESAAGRIARSAKLKAAAKARWSWSELRAAQPAEIAAILFTSGSESVPKAVPLTHRNILTNIRDVVSMFRVYTSDCVLGILPPFHSFGLTTCVVLPLCLGVPVVHHPDPTEGRVLGRLIESYRPTIVIGTPTFLNGIVRASAGEQLACLRLAVTGAEKCPPRVYRALADRCPEMVVIEGYGATECSPIISVNDETDPQPGTIGKVLPSVERAVVNVETGRAVRPGERGELLVRGPSIFDGYLGYDGPSPFVEFDGRQWYRTGDAVTESPDAVLTFAGRLKRFVKIGGEMISLRAIEAVLDEPLRDPRAGDEGPVVAVQPTGDETHPELVVFTTAETDRQAVNRIIRAAGLSALHNIRRVIHLDELPTLGTGKTDYRALAALLERHSRGR